MIADRTINSLLNGSSRYAARARTLNTEGQQSMARTALRRAETLLRIARQAQLVNAVSQFGDFGESNGTQLNENPNHLLT